MKKEPLSLNDISLEDERFRISCFFSIEKLLLSLKKVGLINPPLVTIRNNHYILVTGWKRVLACLEASFSSIPVFVIEEDDDLKAFLIAFYENLATRRYSLLEKAEILKKLKIFGEKEDDIVKHYLPLLDIPQTLRHLDIFLAFSQFGPDLKKFIHERNIPYSSLERLAEFSASERKALFPILQPLSQNKQKEILEDFREIAIKGDIPAEKVLKAEEIQEVINSENLSPLQKADKIRILLKRKKYPHLHSWKDAFDTSLKKMKWPKEIAIHHSPFFEDEALSVNFHFKNEKEFRSHLKKIQEVASKIEFSRLFKLHSDE